MRIGLLFDGPTIPPKDGVIYRFYHIARHLTSQFKHVVLLLGDRGWLTDQQLAAERLNALLFPAPWLYDRNIWRVTRLIRKNFAIDLLHVCNSHQAVLSYGRLIASELNIPLVCDMHDVDHLLLATQRASAAAVQEAAKMQCITGAATEKIIYISCAEASALARIGIPKNKLFCIPNGVCSEKKSSPTYHARDIVFIGNLFYRPNREAVRLITDHIAPRVVSKFPDATFTIIGRTPKPLTKNKYRNVRFVGEIDDLTPILSRSALGIAPLFTGAGLKVKILTYAAHALPVVGTTIAFSGYNGICSFLHAETVEDCIARIFWVFEHRREARAIGVQFSKEIRRGYNWGTLVRRLPILYRGALRTTATPGFSIAEETRADVKPRFVTTKRVLPPAWLQEKRFKNQARLPPPRIVRNGQFCNVLV